MPNLVFLFKYCIYNVHFSIYFNNLGQPRMSIKKIRNAKIHYLREDKKRLHPPLFLDYHEAKMWYSFKYSALVLKILLFLKSFSFGNRDCHTFFGVLINKYAIRSIFDNLLFAFRANRYTYSTYSYFLFNSFCWDLSAIFSAFKRIKKYISINWSCP